MKYGVRKKDDPDSWLIFQPGGRLDHWGSASERAEYETRRDAELAVRDERAECFAVVVPLADAPV
jgi:hypothetical protein